METRFCYFFGGFAASPGVRRMTSKIVKFGFSCSRAKRADADVMLLHFFRKTLCQQQIESLCRSVSGHIRNSLECSGRCDDQNIATATRDHFRKKKTSEMENGGA